MSGKKQFLFRFLAIVIALLVGILAYVLVSGVKFAPDKVFMSYNEIRNIKATDSLYRTEADAAGFTRLNIAIAAFFAAYTVAGLLLSLGHKDKNYTIERTLFSVTTLAVVVFLLQGLLGMVLYRERFFYAPIIMIILTIVLIVTTEMLWAWPRISKGTRKYLKKKLFWFAVTFVAAILLNFFLPRLMRGAGQPMRFDYDVIAATNEKLGYDRNQAYAEGGEKKGAWDDTYDETSKQMGVYNTRSDISIINLVNQQVVSQVADEAYFRQWVNVYDTIERDLGRDGGMLGELLHFVQHIFDGSFGRSTSTRRYPSAVSTIITEGIIWTISLQIPAILVGWLLGNLLGAVAAYKRKIWDKAVMPASLFISAIPAFGSAVILLVIFGINLKWFPANRAYDPGMVPAFSWNFISNVLWHYQLRFWSIVLISIGGQAVGMRSMSIYELNADYVKYSRFLGIKDGRIVRYVFRNAMLPQVTGLAMSIGTSIGGALVAETIFSYPGLGMKMYSAIAENDYNTVSGIALIITIMVLIASFMLDLIYAVIDPRVKAAQFD